MTALLPTSLGASGGSQTALPSSVFPQAAGSPALAAAQYLRTVVLIFATSFFDMTSSLVRFVSSHCLKIQRIVGRNRCVLVGVIFARVLGADALLPRVQSVSIGDGGRPGR